jgi:hypothetical protein
MPIISEQGLKAPARTIFSEPSQDQSISPAVAVLTTNCHKKTQPITLASRGEVGTISGHPPHGFGPPAGIIHRMFFLVRVTTA